MARHLVSCVECGRQFDANTRGTGYNNKIRRYTCPKCMKGIKRQIKEDAKTAEQARIRGIDSAVASGRISESRGIILKHKTGMPKLIGGLILLILGIIWVFMGWKGAQYTVCGIIALAVGIVLIVWFAISEAKYKNALKEERQRSAAARERRESRLVTCPYCGATTRGRNCEYCGQEL